MLNSGRTRRARRVQAKGHATQAQIDARVAYYGGRCAYCRGPYEHIDHAIPLARGGTAWPSNLVPACADCNFRKKARALWEWLTTEFTSPVVLWAAELP
jgi:5-methylcytosine-specific restriction endonuclease McrA